MRFFVLILFLLAFSSCYYDSEEYLYADINVCDTLDVTYQNFISGLLETQCNACHNPSSPSGNVITSNYNDLLIVVNNGKFEGSVNHLPGFSPMPKGANQLPDCDLAKINAWLNAGNPQN